MNSPKNLLHARSLASALILSGVLQVAAGSSLLAQQSLADVCLIYTTRTTYKFSGYYSGSYTATGMVVVGPEFTETVDANQPGGSRPTIPVKKREVLGFALWNDSKDTKKKYYSPSSQSAQLVTGSIDLAKAGKVPSVSIVFTDEPRGYLNDKDVTVGKALWQAPYTGVAPGWLANTLSTTSKSYDVNPNYDYDTNTGIYNFVGQTASGPLACYIATETTTYAYDKNSSELLKSYSNFADACVAVENRLNQLGYVKVE
jgi:hypothetical protein